MKTEEISKALREDILTVVPDLQAVMPDLDDKTIMENMLDEIEMIELVLLLEKRFEIGVSDEEIECLYRGQISGVTEFLIQKTCQTL